MFNLMETRTVGAHDLSMLLWRERELLELLLFKLEEEQLLLTAGKNRWLGFATREVEQVLERLRQSGVERAIAVHGLAEEWAFADGATLREIIEHAPDEVWRDIFAQHLTALGELTEEVRRLRDANLMFLRSAARMARETLGAIDPDAGTYDTQGSAERGGPGARFFERDI